MGEWLVVGAIVIGALVVIVMVATVQLTRLRAKLEEAWDQLALAMRGRHKLASELAESVGSRGLRTDLPDMVAEARTVADLPGASSPYEQDVAERGLDRALEDLDDLIDDSPSMVHDPQIVALRGMIDESQHRIAAQRRDYDVAARTLANTAARWPGRWVAGSMGIVPAPRPGPSVARPSH
ncbi:MAG TPA: LemA family protein [Jiangellaceae bacterium]